MPRLPCGGTEATSEQGAGVGLEVWDEMKLVEQWQKGLLIDMGSMERWPRALPATLEKREGCG